MIEHSKSIRNKEEETKRNKECNNFTINPYTHKAYLYYGRKSSHVKERPKTCVQKGTNLKLQGCFL